MMNYGMVNAHTLGIHILFIDNGKTYDRINMSAEEFANEIIKFSADYDLKFYSFYGNILSFMAYTKAKEDQ